MGGKSSRFFSSSWAPNVTTAPGGKRRALHAVGRGPCCVELPLENLENRVHGCFFTEHACGFSPLNARNTGIIISFSLLETHTRTRDIKKDTTTRSTPTGKMTQTTSDIPSSVK